MSDRPQHIPYRCAKRNPYLSQTDVAQVARFVRKRPVCVDYGHRCGIIEKRVFKDRVRLPWSRLCRCSPPLLSSPGPQVSRLHHLHRHMAPAGAASPGPQPLSQPSHHRRVRRATRRRPRPPRSSHLAPRLSISLLPRVSSLDRARARDRHPAQREHPRFRLSVSLNGVAHFPRLDQRLHAVDGPPVRTLGE